MTDCPNCHIGLSLEVVDEEYARGRNTVMGDDELVSILRRIDKTRFKQLAFLAKGLEKREE